MEASEFSASYPMQWKKYKKELQIQSRLEHPNVVVLKGYSLQPFTLYLEYVEFDWRGFCSQDPIYTHDLYSFLKKMDSLKNCVRTLQEKYQVLDTIALSIADGLAYMHQCAVVHRDLKPQNILVGGNDSTYDNTGLHIYCKITDFGEARASWANTVTAHVNPAAEIGTYPYMAPEVLCPEIYFNPKDEEFKTMPRDVWSFGMIMYMILNPDVRHPFANQGKTCGASGMTQEISVREEVVQHMMKKALPHPSAKYTFLKEMCPSINHCISKCLDYVLTRRKTMDEISKEYVVLLLHLDIFIVSPINPNSVLCIFINPR